MQPRHRKTAAIIALQPLREGRVPAAGGGATPTAPPPTALPAATADALAALIARVAMGDRGAFRAVFELVHSPVFGLCLRMLRHRGEAEEVLQDVFVRVWRHAASFRGDATQPMAWVQAIARNRCLEILRRRGVDDGETRVPLDKPMLTAVMAADARLLVTREPAGGSPTGLPNGQRIAEGVVALLGAAASPPKPL